jgi:hypothetical protein
MFIVINFGKNPVRGGIPARDMISNGIIKYNVIFDFDEFSICEVEVIDILLKIRNNGKIIIEYVIKYISVPICKFMDNMLVIHPMWVIEEYAIIDFNFLWFIPSRPPEMAFILEIIIIIVGVQDLFI